MVFKDENFVLFSFIRMEDCSPILFIYQNIRLGNLIQMVLLSNCSYSFLTCQVFNCILLFFQIFVQKTIKYLEFTKKQRIFVFRFKNN